MIYSWKVTLAPLVLTLNACAGSLISLPNKGSTVVYLPQGHLEYIFYFSANAYDLHAHIFCCVVDVKLHVQQVQEMLQERGWVIPAQLPVRIVGVLANSQAGNPATSNADTSNADNSQKNM